VDGEAGEERAGEGGNVGELLGNGGDPLIGSPRKGIPKLSHWREGGGMKIC
jgi:hypothetical protein